jgi:TPR repeat protein
VILALGYMAWRSAQATSQTAHVESQAPPPVATQAAAPATPEAAPTTSQPEAADRKATADKEPVSAAPGAADGSSAPKPRSAEKTSPVEKPNASSDAEKWTQLDTQAGNGSQELAMALRYLNGVEGERVNKAEAAKWLWKAMAKHNGAATLLLADLYLKGEGVSKNCDQARVLLDSAARAGMKQAGERLRYLQAFGCE